MESWRGGAFLAPRLSGGGGGLNSSKLMTHSPPPIYADSHCSCQELRAWGCWGLGWDNEGTVWLDSGKTAGGRKQPVSPEPCLTLASPCPPNSPPPPPWCCGNKSQSPGTAVGSDSTQNGGTTPGWASETWRIKFPLAVGEPEAQNRFGIDPTRPRQ